ncbi:MAG: dihydropteroate synthase [Candidatus Marinimicrobia bacterium]|nr:dihydropteroate synthase [Candidatus Neomarinimicrobiota bacterium]
MKKVKIMGVLNLAPDSFYDGHRDILLNKQKLASRLAFLKDSDIIDVGCESSRPGAKPISEKEEIERLSTLINSTNKDSFFSIDTYKYKVAKYALENGFKMINDIYAGRFDDNKMLELASDFKVPIVLMHMKGDPVNMQRDTSYDSVIDNICSFFDERISVAKDYGIVDKNIILDPGIGFGKSIDDNFSIVKNIDKFKRIGYKVLIGLSRKSFLSYKGDTPEDRLSATIAMNTLSVLNGADIIRVHDPSESIKMKDVLIKYSFCN